MLTARRSRPGFNLGLQRRIGFRSARNHAILPALVITLLLVGSISARASIINAISPALIDVSTAVSSALDGDVVVIPAGTATWTSGIAVSKAIKIVGAGSGRIIAYDDGNEVLSIGTGSKTISIGGFSPGFSGSSFSVGQTLRIFETNSRSNWMQGTVTSYVGTTLTMNITSTNGSGSTHRWLVATMPSTTITSNGPKIFAVTESVNGNINVSGIQFQSATRTGPYISLGYTSGGQAVLIHDCWFELNQDAYECIDGNTNRGVVSNCSFDGSSGNPGQLITIGNIRIKDDGGSSIGSSWTTPSKWGASDTTGQGNFYIETNDFHALQGVTDNDSNGRMVFRYNLVDHAAFATHGPDTSTYGERYFEYYNNTGVFYGYSDGSTFNIPNGWIGIVRGGTFVVHDNTLPAISSTDLSKPDIKVTVMNLQRNAGPNACWGAGTRNGTDYPAPRQVGLGYITGTGHDGLGRTNDSITYVGDSEPAYIWNNNRSLNVSIADYGGTACTSPDTSVNYIKVNRDFFNGTAKPDYVPYTYPHPLAGGNTLAPPTNLRIAGP